MTPYLEQLTARLVTGMAEVDPAVRERHAGYLLAAQRDDGGFAGREGESDPYYTTFALRALAILGELNDSVAARAGEFFERQLSTRTSVVDFLSLIYGRAILLNFAGIDPMANTASDWRQAVAGELEKLRRDDGGYAKTEEGAAGSLYHSMLVVICQQLIEVLPVEPERLKQFALARQREDGGFVEMAPMKRSGTNPTAAAVALLMILGADDEELRQTTGKFLQGMQTAEGGFCANTRIAVADLLSTFTGLLTLSDLGATEGVDLQAANAYAQSLACESGGFRGGMWDDGHDVEYTFYGLGVLALTTEVKL